MQFLNAGQGEALEVDYDVYEQLMENDQVKEITIIKSEINNYTLLKRN